MIGIQQQTFFVACADNSNVILLKLVNYISMWARREYSIYGQYRQLVEVNRFIFVQKFVCLELHSNDAILGYVNFHCEPMLF